MLLGARLLQGIGAALLVPLSLAMVSVGFVHADLGAAIGWWSGLTATSSAIGPVAGGSITALWSWRAVFVVGLAVGTGVVPGGEAPPRARGDRSGRVDLAGAAMLR